MNICSARLGKHIPVTAMCKHGHDWQSLLSYRSANLHTAALIPGNSTGLAAVCMTLSYVIYWISSPCSHSFTGLKCCTFPPATSAFGMWPCSLWPSGLALSAVIKTYPGSYLQVLFEERGNELKRNIILIDYYASWLQNWYNILIIGYCSTK